MHNGSSHDGGRDNLGCKLVVRIALGPFVTNDTRGGRAGPVRNSADPALESASSVITTIPVGTDPYGVAVDTENGTVFVTNNGSGNVTVINGTTNRVATTVAIGYPRRTCRHRVHVESLSTPRTEVSTLRPWSGC